jgi:hypothetical protein
LIALGAVLSPNATLPPSTATPATAAIASVPASKRRCLRFDVPWCDPSGII